MSELNKTVFDLFAGAGGFGLGFKMADFEVNLSLEKDKWAVDTLRANSSGSSVIIQEDIRSFSKPELIIDAAKGQEPNIIIGGPPCQGFSVAGPSKDPDDPRNTLFIEFAHWVELLLPNIFVMENVAGLCNRRNSKGELVLDIVCKTFERIGYKVEVWKLNAALYGVPQLRNRLFIVGNKFDRIIGPPPVTHYIDNTSSLSLPFLKPAINVFDAIGDLPFITSGEGSEQTNYTIDSFHDYQSWARSGSEFVHNHVAMIHTKRIIERYRHIQNGVSVTDLPVDAKVRKRGGEGVLSETAYHSNYRHLKSDMISYTVPASFYSTFIHPNIPRNVTSREAARIQSFPDLYVFKEKRTVVSSKLLLKKGRVEDNFLSQYNQIGNAVPPLLSYNIAKHLEAFLRMVNRKITKPSEAVSADALQSA